MWTSGLSHKLCFRLWERARSWLLANFYTYLFLNFMEWLLVAFFSILTNKAVVSSDWKMVLSPGVFKYACSFRCGEKQKRTKKNYFKREKRPNSCWENIFSFMHCWEGGRELSHLDTCWICASPRVGILDNIALVGQKENKEPISVVCVVESIFSSVLLL